MILNQSLLRVININNFMQITFLNLRESKTYKLKKTLFNNMDNQQKKIRKVQNSFVIKTFGSISQQRINNISRRDQVILKNRRIATSMNDYSPHKEIRSFNENPRTQLLKRKVGQPRKEKIDLQTIDREKTISLNVNEKLQNKTQQKQKFKTSVQANSANMKIISDRLCSELKNIRKDKTRFTRRNKSQIMFNLSQQEGKFKQNLTDRINKDLYFERAPIIRFSSKKHPQYKSFIQSIYEDKIEKQILFSQRQALMKQIRDEVTERKQLSKKKISKVLVEVKQNKLLKAVVRRKSELTNNLQARKYNPYYSYMNLSEKARKQFISKDKVLDTNKLDKDLENFASSDIFQ